MQTGRCPICNSDVIIEEDAFEGDLANCVNCRGELEIISLHPVQLLEIKKDDQDDLEEQE